MNILDVGRALLRRWWLTVAGLLLTAGAATWSVLALGPVYEYKSTVLLLPPATSLGAGENPYLGLSGLDQVVDVVTRSLTAQPVQDQVASRWKKAEYTVARDVDTSGPLLIVTVDARTAQDGETITKQIVAMVPSTLDQLQSAAGVRPRARVTSTVLTQFDRPEIVRSGQLRLGVAVGAAGLAGTAFLVALVDGILASRQQRQTMDDQPASNRGVKRRSAPRMPGRPRTDKNRGWDWHLPDETEARSSDGAWDLSSVDSDGEQSDQSSPNDVGDRVEAKSGR